MLPHYKPSQSVLTFNWIGLPQVGQVVVARWGQKLIIKRVVEVKNDSVFLAGDYQDSTSSQQLGQFKKSQIIGRVILTF